MRRLTILSVFLLLAATAIAQTSWTTTQLDAANTAKNIAYLSAVERDAIIYINLARMYPKDFAKYEVQDYNGTVKYGDYIKGSPYKQSLIKELNSMQPIPALKFDEELYKDAKCFAAEIGDAGTVTHSRKLCAKQNYAECCSFGMDTGKDIALQWLIDHDVSSLGHREICLDKSYTKIGLSLHKHAKWDVCAVAELIW